jgi:hypothetical protein
MGFLSLLSPCYTRRLLQTFLLRTSHASRQVRWRRMARKNPATTKEVTESVCLKATVARSDTP